MLLLAHMLDSVCRGVVPNTKEGREEEEARKKKEKVGDTEKQLNESLKSATGHPFMTQESDRTF